MKGFIYMEFVILMFKIYKLILLCQFYKMGTSISILFI